MGHHKKNDKGKEEEDGGCGCGGGLMDREKNYGNMRMNAKRVW